VALLGIDSAVKRRYGGISVDVLVWSADAAVRKQQTCRGSKNKYAKSDSVQIAEVWLASRLQCVRYFAAVDRRMMASVDVELFGIGSGESWWHRFFLTYGVKQCIRSDSSKSARRREIFRKQGFKFIVADRDSIPRFAQWLYCVTLRN
jgi:hypothetical protein